MHEEPCCENALTDEEIEALEQACRELKEGWDYFPLFKRKECPEDIWLAEHNLDTGQYQRLYYQYVSAISLGELEKSILENAPPPKQAFKLHETRIGALEMHISARPKAIYDLYQTYYKPERERRVNARRTNQRKLTRIRRRTIITL